MTDAVSTLRFRPLWFEPFLQQLKKKLGYPLDMNKYAQLLTWVSDSWANDSFSLKTLYPVCKLLFLENQDDEFVFDEIFFDYICIELEYEKSSLNKSTSIRDSTNEPPKINEEQAETPVVKKIINSEESIAEPPDYAEGSTAEIVKRYLNLTIPVSKENSVNGYAGTAGGSPFLLTDAYLPLTKREMIHGWRHLRKKMRYRQSNRLDVYATVQHIATEGMLLKPVFEKEQINSDDLLLILADRRGSMQPFHKLTDKLIETAVKDGGHRNAMVFYFYNCPGEYVYKNKNLTEPVLLQEIYSQMRPDHTNALIISDAGAARGNMNELRASKTTDFLYGTADQTGLHKTALFVAWLNPMPRHRWQNSTAAIVDRDAETPMFSLLDDGYGNFRRIIDKLMGR